MADTITTESLVKTFGRTRALDGLTFAVRQGEAHGFLRLAYPGRAAP